MKLPALRMQDLTFGLSLLALICLPIALSEIVRDAGVSLLLPLTLIGAVLAWALAGWGVRKLFSGLILLLLGPLVLYVRIGQLWDSLFEWVRQFFALLPNFFDAAFNDTQLDSTLLAAAQDVFTQRALAFSGRITLWVTAMARGVQIEDPVVRTLIWCLAIWLIAVWAGWQIYRNQKFTLGMFPSTVVLAFVLDYTGKEKEILWFHLALLLFLYGLTNYQYLQKRWDARKIDYSESTSIDTLAATGALTVVLVAVAFLVSTFSIKDILDDFRERRAGSNESQAESLGLESVKDNFRVTGFGNGLPRSYLLKAGPEISTQLAMTISTGELPPMSRNAHPNVPRYYWRTLTYSIYTGAGWSNPTIGAEDIPSNQPLIETENANQRIVRAQITYPDDFSERLYWAGTFISTDVPIQAAWVHRSQDANPLDTDLLAAFAPVETYTVESAILNVSVQELRDSPSVYPDWVRKQFLGLPDSVPERVLSLARDLTASEANAYDRAIAIQNYLREFPYTLDISSPPAGRDVTDYFLFDLKQGYCDYYATSMAVLARAAGLPARLVVGYANGNYDLERARYIVTENYAHSWVEIYFAGIGWVEFEPTASEPVILREDQNDAAASTADSQPEEDQAQNKFTLPLQNIWASIFALLAVASIGIGIDTLRLKRIPPAQTIQILYKRLRRLARPVTGYASKNRTAYLYSSDLIRSLSALDASPRLQNWLAPARNEIELLTELFSRSLFAPTEPSRAEAEQAIQAWASLQWRLALANLLIVVARHNMSRYQPPRL